MKTIIKRAPAKINLAIDILGTRDDGYHLIDMVTIPLKMHDSLEITPLEEDQETFLCCDDPTLVCDESNLVFKALNHLKAQQMIEGKYKLYLHKRIPVQAGLGGGSADAAALIDGLDRFVKFEGGSEERKKKELEIGLKIGSDVPFCILNKPCRVGGTGEVLEEIEVKNPYHVLIVKPQIGLSTKSVYQAYDLIDPKSVRHPDIEALIKALKDDDEEGIRNNIGNVLTYPAVEALPLISNLLNRLKEMNLPISGMSGSGSACFALSKEEERLELAKAVFEKEGYTCFVTQFAL